MKQTFATANSSLSRRPNINIRPKTGQANSSCCHPEQAIFNSDIILYAADNTVRAWAVKARSWEPISAMLPDKTIFISASRSRKIGAVNMFVSTGTFNEAAAKPLLPVCKGIAKAIPATTSSFYTLDFKARRTCAGNERIWVPNLMNIVNITTFVFTAWKQILCQFCAHFARDTFNMLLDQFFKRRLEESKFNDIQCLIISRMKEHEKKTRRAFSTCVGNTCEIIQMYVCKHRSFGRKLRKKLILSIRQEMVGSGQGFKNVKIETTNSITFLSAVNAQWPGLNSDVCFLGVVKIIT